MAIDSNEVVAIGVSAGIGGLLAAGFVGLVGGSSSSIGAAGLVGALAFGALTGVAYNNAVKDDATKGGTTLPPAGDTGV